MTTVLDDAAVLSRLSPALAVAAMHAAVLAAERGELVAPPRIHADVQTFTAGRLAGHWYGYRSYATHLDGPQVVAVHAEPSGELLGLAVGRELGNHRTGALGGLAMDLLARPEARTVGLVGTGSQAWTQIWAISAVRPLAEVRVFSRDPVRRRTFAERITAELGVPAVAVDSVRAAVAERDIVVLATSAGEPVLAAGWISPGTAVTTVGPKQTGRAEFGPDLPERAAGIFTDSIAQLDGYRPAAVLAGREVVSLGAVASGARAGRRAAKDVTLYASVGLAGTEPFLLARLLK
ncbi:ornithine cyclodeaminase family protein [Crossiella sp. CA198]|uniref:ornithine cyclodeaminase family protein n=1 Tax=Crossiella sp. CA198 TaxID=3455607 RepID=UPI003F8D52D2